MDIIKTKDGGLFKIELAGRLDTTTAPEFEAVVNNEFDGVTEVVLDFANLEYVSSAGLRVLLAAQKKMNGVQGKMTVKNVNEEILEVFDITGFSDILTIE